MNRKATLEPVQINPCVRFCGRMWHGLKKPFLLRRIHQPCLEYIEGVPLLCLPDVLNPVVFRSGEFLARIVARHECASPSGSASPPLALDMGTGTGVAAIHAARRGYRVIAVDINPEAVRCAAINVSLNRLEDMIEIRVGDLYSAVAGRRFDLVLFNPPFYSGRPRTQFEHAWQSTDVVERFADGLPGVLSPRGQALVLLSTDGDAGRMLRALADAALRVELVTSRHFGNEIMTIYAARAHK
jgi:methylase of polypeptide subunit release factors